MKVKELIALLQMADEESEVKLIAGIADEVLDYNHVNFANGGVEFDLDDFVDSVNDYNEALAAL